MVALIAVARKLLTILNAMPHATASGGGRLKPMPELSGRRVAHVRRRNAQTSQLGKDSRSPAIGLWKDARIKTGYGEKGSNASLSLSVAIGRYRLAASSDFGT